ncbi:DMT family transporter [Rubrimonas sp.]|uniref:DMT family transporter n=1 Tax=Rubrimonas sp. TaxID=2036015 RepID=UPI002FDC813A
MTPALSGWRLAGAVCVALIAFAANSVLCRMALAGGDIGPTAFTAIRLAAGAAALGLIALVAGRGAQARAAASGLSAAMLFGYAAAFSFAYVALDAGIGALILFGAVQATMFLGALLGGERPGPARWIGGAAAFGGLVWLLSPGAAAPPLVPALLMAAAGACWGGYSLRGRRAGPPLAATAAAFALATPAGLALWAFAGPTEPVGAAGAVLAAASGALASGGGYAVWYAVLPRMEASLAAVAQLTVPVIALAGGMVFLGEALTLRFAVAALVILGGVGAATLLGRRS